MSYPTRLHDASNVPIGAVNILVEVGAPKCSGWRTAQWT